MQFQKFERVDFKCDISFFKLELNCENKEILVLNLKFFCFAWNFTHWQSRRCWFQRWLCLFKVPAQKYPNDNFSQSFHCISLCSLKKSTVLISNFAKSIFIFYKFIIRFHLMLSFSFMRSRQRKEKQINFSIEQ